MVLLRILRFVVVFFFSMVVRISDRGSHDVGKCVILVLRPSLLTLFVVTAMTAEEIQFLGATSHSKKVAVHDSATKPMVPTILPRQGIDDITLLVEAGKPHAAIIFPAGDADYLPVVAQLQDFIQAKTGVWIPARPDREILVDDWFVDDKMKFQHLILLGNLNTNRALVQLAANSCLYTTCQWPGPDGYELRTITNPFGRKKNCILIGGSDVASVKNAANVFLHSVEIYGSPASLRVPRLLEIVVEGEPQRDLDAGPIPERGPFNGTYRLAEVVSRYHVSGSEARLQVVREVLQDYLTREMAPADSDYGTESAIRALDLVDTHVLNDQENHRMDNLVLQWVLNKIEEKPYWNPQGRTWSFGGHQACGALSFYVAVNYLLKNSRPNAIARSILEQQLWETRTYLQYLSTSFKDHRKDVGWETWTPLSVPLRYALAEADMTFFTSGTIVDIVRRHFYAEKEFGPAGMAAFVFNDGRFKTLAPDGGRLDGWAYVLAGARWVTPSSLQPTGPEFLMGTQVMRSSPTDWENAYATQPGPSSWHTPLPYERTFHLVGFASGTQSSDTLTVIGGWDSHSTPGEANSIRVFRQGDHRYLARADGNDQRQPRPGRFYQNSLLVESANYDVAAPCAAELLAHDDQEDLGFAASRLDKFHGVTWDRGVFWRRGRYFVVLDRCQVAKAGPITIVNQWWNRDNPGIVDDQWIARTPSSTFHLLMSDPGQASSKSWWDGGPHQLRQKKHIQAQAGQFIGFRNLFYVDGEESRQHYQTRPLGTNALLVRGWNEQQGERTEEIALVGHSAMQSSVVHGRLRIQAPWFFLAPDLALLKEEQTVEGGGTVATGLWIDGKVVDTDRTSLKAVLRELWDEARDGLRQPSHPPRQDSTGLETKLVKRSAKEEIGIRTGYRPLTGVGVSKDEEGTLTWDLQGMQRVRSIEGIRTPQKRVEIQYAANAPTANWRVVHVPTDLRQHWVYYQYGMAASLGIQTIAPVDVSARYFRVRLPEEETSYGRWIHGDWHNQSWNVTEHNPELFNRPFWQDVTFRSDEPEVDFPRSLVTDLEGDKSEELVVVTDQYELLVFDATGMLRWKRTFEAPITNFICEDLDGDSRREVICATQATAVHVIDYNGVERQTIDMLAKRFSGPNSLSLYVEKTKQRGLFVASYHGAHKYDERGVLLHTESAPGFYIDAMPAVAPDVTGDGVSDVLMRENVRGQVSVLDGKSLAAVASHTTGHTGRGKALIPWSHESLTGPMRVLAIADSGISMLETVQGQTGKAAGGDSAMVLGGLRPVFSFPISPIVAWETADLGDDNEDEIILATRYGGLLVISGQGELVRGTVVASQIFDFTMWDGFRDGPRILVATDQGLVFLDGNLRAVAPALSNTQNCRLIKCLAMGETKRGVCLFADGRVLVLSDPQDVVRPN